MYPLRIEVYKDYFVLCSRIQNNFVKRLCTASNHQHHDSPDHSNFEKSVLSGLLSRIVLPCLLLSGIDEHHLSNEIAEIEEMT